MPEVYEPDITLDRDSEVPLYRQISEPIERAIVSGSLRAGAMIEDEISMAERLDVARPTARRALQELAGLGLISRRRGIGTTVTPPHVHRTMKLSSLNDDLKAAGLKPTTKILSYEVRECNEKEADDLKIEAGTAILAVRRLRYADGHPLAVLSNLLPLDIAPSWHDLASLGLYNFLESRDITLASAKQTIGAKAASEQEATELGEEPNAPLLTMKRLAFDTQGRVIEVGSHVYRASLYSFDFTLFHP